MTIHLLVMPSKTFQHIIIDFKVTINDDSSFSYALQKVSTHYYYYKF